MNRTILDALEKAKSCGILGKDVTPFLLNAIGQITNNKSLQTSTAKKQQIIIKNEVVFIECCYFRYCIDKKQRTCSRSNFC